MIWNVEIINENEETFEIITHEVIGETEYVKVAKIKKTDVFPNTKMFMELQIMDDLNEGKINTCYFEEMGLW